jgi:hypothetical protein
MLRSRAAKVVVALLALVLLYAAVGFGVVPKLIERSLAQQVRERLGCELAVERLRFDPFRFVVDARGLRVCEPGRLLSAEGLRIDFDPFSSGLGRGWVFGDVTADALDLNVERSRDGRFNLVELIERASSKGEKSAGPPPLMVVRRLALSQAAVSYTDRSQRDTPAVRLSPINAELLDLSSAPDAKAHGTLDATAGKEASVQWSGEVEPGQARSQGELKLHAELALPWRFLRPVLALSRAGGSVEANARYAFDAQSGLALSRLDATVSDLALERDGDAQPFAALRSLQLRNGRFDPSARKLEAGEIAAARGRLSLAREPDGSLDWSRLVRPSEEATAPREARKLALQVAAVKLSEVDLHFADATRKPALGLDLASLDAQAALTMTLGGATEAVLRDAKVSAASMALQADNAQPVALESLKLDGALIDLGARAVSAASLAAAGGRLKVVRMADGRLELAELFHESRSEQTPDPWKFALDEARIESLQTQYTDATFSPPLSYSALVSARGRNIGREQGPIALELSAKSGKGLVNGSGTVSQDFQQADMTVRADALPLAPLETVLSRFARLRMPGGTASANVKLAWRGGPGNMKLDGRAAIDSFRLVDAVTGEPLLGWRKLSAGSVRFDAAAHRAIVGDVIVEEPDARVHVSEKRELNLAQVVRDRPAEPARTKAPETKTTIRIASLRVRNGAVQYSDASLLFPFEAKITDLAGAVTRLSSDPKEPATLDLSGRIAPFGEARLQGSLDALSPRSFADLAVRFDNVPLPTLSPYSATFLGRTMAEGRLWLDLHYRINDAQLTGDNRISIRNLRLGEKVDAPNALDVPLDLAVALLTDSKGEFTTDVQVTGDLNNPKFNIGGLVRAALGNLVTRVVTAPFRALGFGRRGEDEAPSPDIEFDPGSARIAPPQEEKLVNLAKALSDRPLVKVPVPAPYSADADVAALRERAARERLAIALGRSPEEARALDVSGPRAVAAMRSLLPAAPDVARNESPDEVFRRFVAAQPVDEQALHQLAAERAHSIQAVLESHGLERARIDDGNTVEQRSTPIRAQLSLVAASG